jgi:hypothetical protein
VCVIFGFLQPREHDGGDDNDEWADESDEATFILYLLNPTVLKVL